MTTSLTAIEETILKDYSKLLFEAFFFFAYSRANMFFLQLGDKKYGIENDHRDSLRNWYQFSQLS